MMYYKRATVLNISCNALTNRLVRAVQLKHDIAYGCTPNVCTDMSLTYGMLKAEEVSKALAILRRMEKRGCEPDLRTYTSLIDGLLRANEVDKAFVILTEMEKRGCPPDRWLAEG
ncbi:hypothetical protein L7F22_003736 [Adiantum nelumboides]|nr:hypothetical protein [Adiantum nelumboides]